MKFILIFCLFFSCVFGAKSTQNLDFTKLSNDEILELFKDKSVLRDFAANKKLNALKKKLLSKEAYIRVWGDSHMASDFFSRAFADEFFTQNAIGFSYPLQPKYQQNLKLTYSSSDFELLNSKSVSEENIDYAMGGIIAKAQKKGAKIKLDTNLENKKFKIGFVFKSPTQTNAFSIKDSTNKQVTLRPRSENRWYYKEFQLSFPLEISALRPDAALGGYFIMRDKNNAIIDTLGVNGAKSDLFLKWNNKITQAELSLFKNDLIIISYGSNDGLNDKFDKKVFKENLRKLIALSRKFNENATFLLISPPTLTQKNKKGNYVLSPNFKAVQEAVLEVAKKEKTLFFDMHKFIEISGGKSKWAQQKLSLKDVHLSLRGYELMAKKLAFDMKKLLKIK